MARAHAETLRCRSAELRRKAETITDRLVLVLTAHDRPLGQHDDVFFLRLPRVRPAVALARYDLRLWLRSRGVPAEDTAAIVLACSEACANAVEHPAGRARPGFEVEARHKSRDVQLAVRDFGDWKSSKRDDVTRGRGLKMMHALMDRVEVERAPTGTRVVMRRSLVH
jgi:anti-sigma regulatory factor (Ser/Thr protein kinase)